MDLGEITSNRRAGVVAMRLSRFLPPRLGYILADSVAKFLASHRELTLVQGIRANQWVVGNKRSSAQELDLRMLEVLNHIALSFYDLFHYSTDESAMLRRVVDSPEVLELIRHSQSNAGGLIVCGLHMSNFDLAYQSVTMKGLNSFALSLPEANEAIAWQHELRYRAGIEVLPATRENLRQVIQRLNAGEILVTGIDRPVPTAKLQLRFFNEPANLPVHHVQLALHTGVPLIVMAVYRQVDGRCRVKASELIHVKHCQDREAELRQNAETLLEIVEGFIRQDPAQWAMFHSVWPDAIAQAP
jgi:lauroyl/myristoyl acyltransferase